MSKEDIEKINRSHDEATKNGRKGGVKSGETRRQNKKMKTMFGQIMSLGIQDENLRREMEAYGIGSEDMTVTAATCFSIAKKAMNGNIDAATFIAMMTGQKPNDKLDISGRIEKPITLPPALKNATLEELRSLGVVTPVKLADTSEYE